MLNQILKQIPRTRCEHLVSKSGADRAAKGLPNWSQLAAKLTWQLGHIQYLRQVGSGRRRRVGDPAPTGSARSTRSLPPCVNTDRARERFDEAFNRSGVWRVDSTRPLRKSRRAKRCLTLRQLLDQDGHLFSLRPMCEVAAREMNAASRAALASSSGVLDGGGYSDYWLFALQTGNGVYISARLKDKVLLEIVDGCAAPRDWDSPTSQIIQPKYEACPGNAVLCAAEYRADWRRCRQNLGAPDQPREPAHLSRRRLVPERWQATPFFKSAKQYRKIQAFFGASPGAVKNQIWTVLTAMLLLRHPQVPFRLGVSRSRLAAQPRISRFTHRRSHTGFKEPIAVSPGPSSSLRHRLWPLPTSGNTTAA
jgi:hypothetical protein